MTVSNEELRSLLLKYRYDIIFQVFFVLLILIIARTCSIENFLILFSSESGELPGSGPYKICIPNTPVAVGLIVLSLAMNLLLRNWRELPFVSEKKRPDQW